MDQKPLFEDKAKPEADIAASDDLLARRTVLESLGVSFDFKGAVDSSSKSAKKKTQRRSAARMNLLDHDGALLGHLRTGLVGMGIFSLIQGLLMSSFLSVFLGCLSGMGGVMSGMMKTGLHYLQPVIDQTQHYLNFARAHGLPVDDLRAKMMHDMPRDMLMKRVGRYALFTMLGRGGASFWLGAAGIGTLALTSPTTLTSILGMGSSATLLAQAVIQSGPEILNYRQMVHPDFVMDRIDDVLQTYGAEVKTRDMIKTLESNEVTLEKGKDALQAVAMGIQRHSWHGLYEGMRDKTPIILQTSTQMLQRQIYQGGSVLGVAQRVAARSGVSLQVDSQAIYGNVAQSLSHLDIDAMESTLESSFSSLINRSLVRV